MGGAPKGYDAAAFGRDFSVFLPFVKKAAPDMLVLGPGGVGEGIPLAPIGLAGSIIKNEDILKATGPQFDGFSYHSYGATSKRCASMGPASQTTAEAALSENFLSRADRIAAFYAGLRDRFEPGKPLWLTETADAACGGNPWASTFLDSFRYLDQLGRLSKRGVQVHMHNTLASSDYGLLDVNTLMPRPNYWAALLWHKFMGKTVLDPGLSTATSLHIYSHCLRGEPGGVALLVINTDRSAPQSLDLAQVAERYTLTAPSLDATSIQLNASELKLGEDDAIPSLTGISAGSGHLTFSPATITFVAIPNANNASCQ
jgi:heparanase 1